MLGKLFQDNIKIIFSMENAENGCMNHVPCMGCFVIHVEGMRREKQRQKRPAVASLPHLKERCHKSNFFSLLCACGHMPLVSSLVDFVLTAEELFNYQMLLFSLNIQIFIIYGYLFEIRAISLPFTLC
jgi:hypothetical protein